MIARLAGAVLLLAAASCASERPSIEETVMAEATCDVSVTFGSFASGIDRRAAAGIEALIRADPSVTSVTRSPAGREGEYRLCVHTRSPTAAGGLFAALKASLDEPVRAPVTLSGPAGSYSALTRM